MNKSDNKEKHNKPLLLKGQVWRCDHPMFVSFNNGGYYTCKLDGVLHGNSGGFLLEDNSSFKYYFTLIKDVPRRIESNLGGIISKLTKYNNSTK